ncbi:hypothetical protein CTM_16187 [Clostridium tetanomorphum DSM 665]|nr:hypothetical protein CTM_16187 [Clostridium tetanomorphum DSM 665]
MKKKYVNIRYKFILIGVISVILALPNLIFSIYNNRIYAGSNLNLKREKKEIIKQFKDIKLRTDDIKFKFRDKNIENKFPIYIKNNRYYIPVEHFVIKSGGEYNWKNDKIGEINFGGYKIRLNLLNNNFKNAERVQNLKEKIIFAGDIAYISLYDFTKMLNMKTSWDIKNKVIYLFNNKDNISVNKIKNTNKVALIRLEDMSSEDRYSTSESLEKIRIIGDYLYSKFIPFHIAWVPKYINPKKRIDNDLATKYTMHNVDFLYTLDYLMDRNALIGVHGYTHQYGNEISIDGIELDGRRNNTVSKTREVAKKSIQSGEKLNVPIHFFESAHYAATDMQHRELEKYFDYMYEPPKFTERNNVARRKQGNRTVKYIPTPLIYVDGKRDTDNMIRKINNINNINTFTLASFFYHPNIEFEYIKLYKDKDGYPAYSYSEKSPLKRIINTFESKGYKFIKITDIK